MVFEASTEGKCEESELMNRREIADPAARDDEGGAFEEKGGLMVLTAAAAGRRIVSIATVQYSVYPSEYLVNHQD